MNAHNKKNKKNKKKKSEQKKEAIISWQGDTEIAQNLFLRLQ